MHALPLGDALYFFDEIGGRVVDRMIRTQSLGRRAFVVRPTGNDNRQPEQLAQLDRHGSNSAGAAVHQYGFAFDRIGALEYIVPDGE